METNSVKTVEQQARELEVAVAAAHDFSNGRNLPGGTYDRECRESFMAGVRWARKQDAATQPQNEPKRITMAEHEAEIAAEYAKNPGLQCRCISTDGGGDCDYCRELRYPPEDEAEGAK